MMTPSENERTDPAESDQDLAFARAAGVPAEKAGLPAEGAGVLDEEQEVRRLEEGEGDHVEAPPGTAADPGDRENTPASVAARLLDQGASATQGTADAVASRASGDEPLLSPEAEEEFLQRWSDVQIGFVHDPRQCAQDASALVDEIAATYQKAFDERRSRLSAAWHADEADTEDLRNAVRGYRTFIRALLPR